MLLRCVPSVALYMDKSEYKCHKIVSSVIFPYLRENEDADGWIEGSCVKKASGDDTTGRAVIWLRSPEKMGTCGIVVKNSALMIHS